MIGRMRTKHDGDCTIYARLRGTSMPEHGICTCGYGWQQARKGDWNNMYSEELQEKLEKEAKRRGVSEKDIIQKI